MENPKITVADFIRDAPAEMQLKLLAGEKNTTSREITAARIQKLGLALAGFAHYIHAGRIQIVGQSEILFLNQLEREKRIEAIRNLNLEEISCILITNYLTPPPELIEIAEKVGLPVLRTTQVSSKAIEIITNFLRQILAPQLTIHGVLVGIFGIGVLMLGESGIGKSECALDLVARGHNLISDDVIIVKRIGDRLQGTSPELTHEHLEIRGLGIINIRNLFGVSAIGKQKKQIDLCVELKRWDAVEEVERLGVETKTETILGVQIPKFILPVSSGRNLSTLVETAVRIHLLKVSGYDAAQELIEKHTKLLTVQPR
ncbi:MAG: HPr(Ser) kinase/phosphatase [Pyrinomonadaceae bacterium]